MGFSLRSLILAALLAAAPAYLARAQTAPPAPAHKAEAQKSANPKPGAPKQVAKATPVVHPPAAPAAHKPATKHAKAAPARPAPVVAAPPVAEKPAAEAPQAATPDPAKGSATGLPLPRFAALRSDEVNFRAGPGTRYPIDWIYKRRDLPVEIEREFEVWRLVRDPDGTKGWVHQATLTGRRTFIVSGAEHTLRDAAQDTASPVANLMPGVIGRVRACAAAAAWCEVQVGDYRGWIKRADIWGVNPGEAIN